MDRDRPARRGVKSRTTRRRDELHAAAQIGCDVESGLLHRREPLRAQQGASVAGLSGRAGFVCTAGRDGCADSLCGPGRRIDDADVDVSGRLLTDGIAEFPA